MKHAIIILLLIAAGTACKKKQVVFPANELHYKETQCSDPWTKRVYTHLGLPPSDTGMVKYWLNDNGITALNVTFTERTGGITCAACTCPTGRTLRVLFDPGDIEKAKALGFL